MQKAKIKVQNDRATANMQKSKDAKEGI